MAKFKNTSSNVVVSVDDDKADRYQSPQWEPAGDEPKKKTPAKRTAAKKSAADAE